jgi:hypothetical protein
MSTRAIRQRHPIYRESSVCQWKFHSDLPLASNIAADKNAQTLAGQSVVTNIRQK